MSLINNHREDMVPKGPILPEVSVSFQGQAVDASFSVIDQFNNASFMENDEVVSFLVEEHKKSISEEEVGEKTSA